MSVLSRLREMSGILTWYPMNCPETPMKGEYVFLRGGFVVERHLGCKPSPLMVSARFDTQYDEWVMSYFDLGQNRVEYDSPTHWAHIPGVTYL